MPGRSMIAVAAAALLFACGGDDTADDPPGTDATVAADPADETRPEENVAAAGVTTAATDLGEVLVDEDGMTLYLFDPDDQGASTCSEECAQTWPPVAGPLVAGNGVDPTLLGTVAREDGTTQATYDGWPLYLFAGDRAPGDVTGHGVQDVWWALAPDGARAGDDGDSGQEGVGY